MFLKHRNRIAYILLILAALGWSIGQQLFQYGSLSVTDTTIAPDTSATVIFDTTFPSTSRAEDGTSETEDSTYANDTKGSADSGRLKWVGALLRGLSMLIAAVAVLLLYPKTPTIGPDGALALLAVAEAIRQARISAFSLQPWGYGILLALVLGAVRELWGWTLSRLRLPWCAVYRVTKRCPTPRRALFVAVLPLVIGAVCMTLLLALSTFSVHGLVLLCLFLAVVLAAACLWRYGADLWHLQKQLLHFQNDSPVTANSGFFEAEEASLSELQIKTQEALRTAVAGERFKVELIANVSHDLRTPLTAILGYGELLQKEKLSEEGAAQLLRLNRKAGYMRDLVDALFELTKVSSGVLESKKEELDLIRLLEQTVGLLDDQLTDAGLAVRRHYEADSVILVTDGARMHQVFANLLENAIKYALAGTRIHLEVKENETEYTVRMVNIASYEMDFEPEEILQRFSRGDKARTTSGSGLGLAIAQTYTESVGGRFRVSIDGDQFSAIVTLPKSERNL